MKKIQLMILLALVAALFTGCALDVIATGSEQAIDRVFRAMPDGVSLTAGDLTITAPDGSAAFVLNTDWSGDMDAYLSVDLQPFLDAGLDATKLPTGYAVEGDKLLVGRDFGDGAIAGDTPIARYNSLVASRPDALGFHASLGHFGIGLSGGMFEWTRDLSESDKDIVYVLDPAPLEAAGLNPEAQNGWVYAQIETMDSYGAKITVWRLLKPYDIAE